MEGAGVGAGSAERTRALPVRRPHRHPGPARRRGDDRDGARASSRRVQVKILLSWSSGKDSAWALHVLRQQGANVAGLLTSLNESVARVSMHGVREDVLRAQAHAAGLLLSTIPLPWP